MGSCMGYSLKSPPKPEGSGNDKAGTGVMLIPIVNASTTAMQTSVLSTTAAPAKQRATMHWLSSTTLLFGLFVLAASIDPVEVYGNKFFNKDGSQFFLKGIAYQLRPDDPLIDTEQCKRDANLMKELGTNTLRVYHVDAKANHDGCMAAFADVGIYLMIDLDTFDTYIVPNNLFWNQTQYERYAEVMDTFHDYSNVLGFFIGNENIATQGDSLAAPFLKAAARDMKAYRDAKGYRPIPVGYSAADIKELRPMLQNYLTCGGNSSEIIDFFSLNSYSWCDPSSYEASTYDRLQEYARDFPVPIFFSETGCIVPGPRIWADQEAIFSKPMVEHWSGAIVYEWIQEQNNYGLVSYGPPVDDLSRNDDTVFDGWTRKGEPTPRSPDFQNLKSRWETIHPTGISKSHYDAAAVSTRACPTATQEGWWAVDGNIELPSLGETFATIHTSSASITQSINETTSAADTTSAGDSHGEAEGESEDKDDDDNGAAVLRSGYIAPIFPDALKALLPTAIETMAEAAQAEVGAAMPSAVPTIKEESILDGLDFSLPPELAMKRPFEEVGESSRENENPEAKRVKTENEAQEESLEDGLALLVQNALSNVGDLVDQFNAEAEIPIPSTDAVNEESAPAPQVSEPPTTFMSHPEKFVHNATLHALGNLGISLLLALVQPPFEDTLKALRQADSEHARAFKKLQTSFQATRDLFATSPVLSIEELALQDSDSRTIIEVANLAMLCVWLFEGGLGPCTNAEDHFFSIFQHQMSDLLPDVSDLCVALKTQRAIEALAEKDAERKPDDLLSNLLDHGVEDRLRQQHGHAELTPQEHILISSLQSRKAELLAACQPDLDLGNMRQKYPSNDLLRAFGTYIKGRLTSLSDLGTKLGVPIPPIHEVEEVLPNFDDAGEDELDLDDLSSFFEKTTSGLVQNALAGLTDDNTASTPVVEVSAEPAEDASKKNDATPQTNGKIDFMTDYKELEALVAESTSNYVKTTLHGLSPVTYQPTIPTSTAESMTTQSPYLSHLQQHHTQHPYYSYTQSIPEPQAQPPAPGENLPPNQTFPSAILYDKARQAALSKSSAHTRREGLHSTRRPWTQEEEKALMAGLDMVKGPHWSQILTLFGQNGTISDILKDRTQVQLKDKARNLKLFFLKTNSEMPYYLQAVTGELKTRAPTQAARKEAEERARLNSEEDQAKLQGIMALAGGLQHPPQGRTNGSPAAVVGASVVTPAQAASAAQAATTGLHPTAGPATSTHSSAASSGPVGTMPTATAYQKAQAQANATQMLQSVPQAPPRPQSQLPPHYQRPQHQQQPHTQTQPSQQPQQHSQQQPQQAQPQSHTASPIARPGSATATQLHTPQAHTPQAPTPTMSVGTQDASASPNSICPSKRNPIIKQFLNPQAQRRRPRLRKTTLAKLPHRRR
ncbi:Telomeric DNA-binding factor trf1 [Paramyrothecium foliicola]|nr:Telomeric DNA-binding factor trf1 [Paramyrothecium foliicola]